MLFEEVIPHLNKVATLYLVNNRRRTGWLFIHSVKRRQTDSVEEVYFVTVARGRKLLQTPRAKDQEKLEQVKQRIRLCDIIRIRSID